MIDWNDYRYFLAVAETGSLSAAGRRLRVAQPTVGRRIQALEENLGVRLFDRLSHGYVPTAAAAAILQPVQDLELQALTIERRIAGADSELVGKVCVSTTEGLGYWIALKLPQFYQRYPKLELEVSISTGMSDLLRHEADIALRVGHPVSEELIGRRIGGARFALYASIDYLNTYGEPVGLDDLPRHRIIESTGELANLQQVRRLREVASGADMIFHCNDLTVQLLAAQSGIGIATLPVYYLLFENRNLRRILADKFDLRLDLWLLSHRDLRNTARIRAVRDFLAEAATADASLLNGITDLTAGTEKSG